MTARGVRTATSMLLGILAAALGATSASAAPSVTPAADQDSAVVVEILGITPQVLTPGEDLVVTARVTNDGAVPLEDVSANLLVNRFRMTSRAEVAEWAALPVDADAGRTDVTVPLDEPLAPDSARSVTLTLAADRVNLLDLPGLWGPRGLAVEATVGGERAALERSYLLWNPDDSTPRVPVSVVLPFVGPATATEPAPVPTAGPTATPSPKATEDAAADAAGAAGAQALAPDSDAELADLVAPGGRLSKALAAADVDGAVAMAVDPALLAEADAAGGQAATWADRVRTIAARHTTYALPWSDPDVAAVAHSGVTELLDVAAGLTSDVDGPVGGQPLVVWDTATQSDEATLTAATRLHAAAVVAAPARVLTSDSSASSDGLALATTSAGSVSALTPDPVLTSLVVAPQTDEPGATPAAAAQRALAELALVARETPVPVGVVVAPTRDQVPDPATLRAVVEAVRDAPWAQMASATSLLSKTATLEADPPARVVASDEIPSTQVTALTEGRADVLDFAEVVTDPATFLDGVDEQALAPLAVAWRADPEERSHLVHATLKSQRTRTQGLSIVPMSNVNVIASQGDVRVVVSNALGVAATAQVVVEPRKACVSAGEVDPVTIDPGSDASVAVPLTAHANCDVVIEVHLVGPQGQEVADPIEFDARVSPRIESVGTIVVAVLLAIGLVLGIARTIRRGQSARRGARTEAEADAPTSLPVLGGTPDDPDDASDPPA